MKRSAPLPRARRLAALAFASLVLGGGLVACAGDERSEADKEQAQLAESRTVTARLTDTGLELSTAKTQTGPITFRVLNAGTKPFGLRMKGTGVEINNVQPGSSASMVVRLEPGAYDFVSLTGSGAQAVEGQKPARLVVTEK